MCTEVYILSVPEHLRIPEEFPLPRFPPKKYMLKYAAYVCMPTAVAKYTLTYIPFT